MHPDARANTPLRPWGPDIVTADAGGNTSSVPSAVAVALFAVLATWPIARYGLRQRQD
jgi:hypothetical protein